MTYLLISYSNSQFDKIKTGLKSYKKANNQHKIIEIGNTIISILLTQFSKQDCMCQAKWDFDDDKKNDKDKTWAIM